jgi:protein-serine/threonine kinase
MADDNKTAITGSVEPYVRPQRNSAPYQQSPIPVSNNDSHEGGGKRSSSQSPTVPRIQIDPNKPPPPPPRRKRVTTIASGSEEFSDMSDHLSSPKYSNNNSTNTSPSSSKISSPAVTPPSSPTRDYTINTHCNNNESTPPRKNSANADESPEDSPTPVHTASPSSFLRTHPKRGLRGIAISPTGGKTQRPLPPTGGPHTGVNNGRLSILGVQREHLLLGFNTPGQTPPMSPSTSPPTSPRDHGIKLNGSADNLASLTSSGESSPSPSVPKKDRVNLSHFKLIKLIGKGGFGEVYLVEHIKSGKKLALKVMDKRDISKKDKVQSIKNERNVLVKGKLHNAWLVRLHYSFQDKAFLYLAMEYCPGGDLRAFISAHGDLEEEDARLYFAEMILAVHTLHQMGYIHRDLKPDNFLIDKNGHLKLADFGLSKEAAGRRTQLITPPTRAERRGSILNVPKQLETLSASNFDRRFQRTRRESTAKKALPKPQTNGRAYSIVGSPDYMSPEVLTQEGYGEEVDWWSLGVIFFEMILGIPPFGGDTPEEVFEAIGNYRQLLPSILAQYRPYMTADCFALIGGLLCDPKNRLGDQEGIERFKKLKFFAGLDWDNVLELDPPFRPILDDDLDTKYFHVEDPGQTFSDGEPDG